MVEVELLKVRLYLRLIYTAFVLLLKLPVCIKIEDFDLELVVSYSEMVINCFPKFRLI